MTDGYGRVIDYIRISVTDRCNLRCVYCMPPEGVQSVCHDAILRYDEILRLAEIFASLGIQKIKLTGGEPLVRKGLPQLVADLKQIPGIGRVTITTNGLGLKEQMQALAGAGIDGINLSLDTLNPAVFEKITRRPAFDQVTEGLQEALKYPEIPLKINCVPMKMAGQNVVEIAKLARNYKIHVRYIEMMPIGLGKNYGFQSEEEILEELETAYGPCHPFDGTLGNGPGHYVSFEGFAGKIGFISAISHKFCERCNRVRLTSQGFLKTCLQYERGADLRELLRGGASDEEIRSAAEAAIRSKPASHQFLQRRETDTDKETHTMSQIGG